jgi:hypothetical protein
MHIFSRNVSKYFVSHNVYHNQSLCAILAPSIHQLVLSRLVNLALPMCFANVVPYIYVYLIALCFLSDEETTALNIICIGSPSLISHITTAGRSLCGRGRGVEAVAVVI